MKIESDKSKKTWAPGQNGKGDAPRIGSFRTYQAHFDEIFRKPSKDDKKPREREGAATPELVDL